MKYYPVYLDINNRSCLVVGGGGVGTRKVRGLLKSGATVTVVSPEVTPEIKALAEQGRIVLCRRPFRSEDLETVFMVIGATSDEALNRRINKEAEDLRMLCNIADVPEVCNFILPAIVERGDLVIAVSTSGNSPAFAKWLRKKLEMEFGEEYDTFLKLMGAVREKLLSEAHAPEAHKHLFEALIDNGLLDHVRNGRKAEIDAVMAKVLGDGFKMSALLGE
jgi:precorrin-2 dehydrogenase/sirohydrochlorin ferrochelatase